MKISAARAERFVKRPDPKARAVLVYGPDRGLVRERAEALARGVVEDLADPFRVTEMTGAALAADPARLADEAAGRVRAEVRSASPLRDDQQERLKQALARRTGKEIDLSVHVDPSLLGGAIATLGGLVIDGSLRTQLEQLQVTLTQGRGSRSR